MSDYAIFVDVKTDNGEMKRLPLLLFFILCSVGAMAQNRAKVIFSISKENYTYEKGDYDELYETAFEHTGVGNEGDYIKHSLLESDTSTFDFGDKYVFALELTWAATKEQEDEIT